MKPFYTGTLLSILPNAPLPESPSPALSWYRIDEGEVDELEEGWQRDEAVWGWYGTNWLLVLAEDEARAMRCAETFVVSNSNKLTVGQFLSSRPFFKVDGWVITAQEVEQGKHAPATLLATVERVLHAAEDLEELCCLMELADHLDLDASVFYEQLDLDKLPRWGPSPSEACREEMENAGLTIHSWDETRMLCWDEDPMVGWHFEERADAPMEKRSTKSLMDIIEHSLDDDVDIGTASKALKELRERLKKAAAVSDYLQRTGFDEARTFEDTFHLDSDVAKADAESFNAFFAAFGRAQVE